MKKISKRQKPTRPRLFQVSLALLGIILILISCDSCRKPKDPITPNPPDPPASSTLKITSLSGSASGSTITVNFSATSNYNITYSSLKNNNSGNEVNVLGKSSQAFNNLNPGTDYSFTFNVKDKSGKTVSQSVTLRTEDKKSAWVKSVSLVYSHPTLMDRNTQSDTLKLKIVSTASATKTLDSLVVDFGENGEAVKMLRYRQADTASWTILQPSDTKIKFTNLTLVPGENIIPAIFAIKKDPPANITNNAPLTLKVVSIDDGEGGTRAIEDFAQAIPVGSVNTVTEPTYIDPTFGMQYGTIYGNTSLGPNGQTEGSMASIMFKFSGPSGAKIKSVRLYNPYHEFQGLVYSDWRTQHFNQDSTVPGESFNNATTWSEGQKYLTLDFTNINENVLYYNQWGNYNQYDMGAKISNPVGNPTFESFDYTPGEYEWYLLSPFDLVILDMNGQIVDMSNVQISKKI